MKKIIDMLKSMTNSKKKVFALALSVCVVVLSIASSSIAYFTDTASYTNTFTSGKVDILLTVNTDEIESSEDYTHENAYPGEVIPKLTVIKNKDNSQSAYIGAIITVNAPKDFLTVDTAKNLFDGLSTNGGTVYAVKSTVDNVDTFKIYVVYEAAKDKNTSVTVFNNVVIPSTWDSAEMEKFVSVNFDVVAYAVQAVGMGDDALTALQTAFKDEGNPVFANKP